MQSLFSLSIHIYSQAKSTTTIKEPDTRKPQHTIHYDDICSRWKVCLVVKNHLILKFKAQNVLWFASAARRFVYWNHKLSSVLDHTGTLITSKAPAQGSGTHRSLLILVTSTSASSHLGSKARRRLFGLTQRAMRLSTDQDVLGVTCPAWAGVVCHDVGHAHKVALWWPLLLAVDSQWTSDGNQVKDFAFRGYLINLIANWTKQGN